MLSGPKSLTPEELRRRGYIELESVGYVHIFDLPNGPLHDFGADIFEEAFGVPEDTEALEDHSFWGVLYGVIAFFSAFKRSTQKDTSKQSIRNKWIR